MAGIFRIKTGILLSGGIDSACVAYWKRPTIAFNINYGQRPAVAERAASHEIAKSIGIPLVNIDIDCSSLGSGDLTDEKALSIAPTPEWWPYRNQLLVTLACMKAVQSGVKKLLVGTVSTDKKQKDGRKQFYEILNSLVKFQEGGIQIITPAIHLTATELATKSKIPDSVLGWTHSCHVSNFPCGKCNGCLKHLTTKKMIFNL